MQLTWLGHAGFRLELPPLRERREDIGMLAALFLARKAGKSDYPGITVAAAQRLLEYTWPLNVRELESALSTAYVLAGPGPVDVAHLPESVQTGNAKLADIQGGASIAERSSAGMSQGRPLSATDRELRSRVIDHLRKHAGNISAVARDMGKDRKQIQRWLKRFQIDAEQFRGS